MGTKRSRFVPSPEEQARLREIGRKANEAAGITGEPTVTPEELKARMVRKGVRPEDRIFTRELLRARYGDEEAK
jgi:hypothetical protein